MTPLGESRGFERRWPGASFTKRSNIILNAAPRAAGYSADAQQGRVDTPKAMSSRGDALSTDPTHGIPSRTRVVSCSSRLQSKQLAVTESDDADKASDSVRLAGFEGASSLRAWSGSPLCDGRQTASKVQMIASCQSSNPAPVTMSLRARSSDGSTAMKSKLEINADHDIVSRSGEY